MNSQGAVTNGRIEPWKAIAPSEFRQRQDRVRRAVAAAGLDGVVVYSRGGAFLDMYADVLYLTNHYSQQPYMGDHAGIGSARAHGVAVIPVDGDLHLIVDVPWWRSDLVVADHVRESTDVTAEVGRALVDSRLSGKRVGLVGVSFMTAAAYLGLVGVAGDTTFVRVDDLVERIRVVKSHSEQGLIRQSVEIGNKAAEALMEAAVEGATEADTVRAALDVIVPAGAALYDAPCASGPNASNFVWSRLPSYDAVRPMERGEIFHFDSYGAYGGYLWDFGRSRVIGDEPNPKQRLLLESVIEGVEVICSAIRPGIAAHDVFLVGADWLRESPVGSALPEFPAVGHGIGMSWELPWLQDGDETVIEPGMHLAVELLLGYEGEDLVMFEHNGLVTERGFEILSTCRARWWT